MPDRNDTGWARKCSWVWQRVQVCGLPLLRSLWLNHVQDWAQSFRHSAPMDPAGRRDD
jgi:hypothetical protein